jgi:hypothetical protein
LTANAVPPQSICRCKTLLVARTAKMPNFALNASDLTL